MLEREFQAKIIRTIKDRYPDAVVIKNDPNYMQGVPDLAVFHNDHWAMLECKADPTSPTQPNQKYYIDKFDRMSFAKIINPVNQKEVLNEMESLFQS